MAEKCCRDRYDTSAAYLFGVAFVVLRLLGEIDWPWIWVTAPIWGGIVLRIVFQLAGDMKEKRNG